MSIRNGTVFILAMILVATANSMTFGMIRGDKGNTPIADPGWPKGVAKIVNSPHRIAWYEDPPFGGGRWHSECQGDTEKLSQVIEDLAKTESVKKRILVHSGVTRSFWLDPNRQQIGNRALELDWVFVVWEKEKWDFQKGMPHHISALQNDKSTEPFAELHVYTGGLVDWKQIRVPDGIEVVDNRLESHGFSIADRRVIEGQIINFDTNQPLMATVFLETRDAASGKQNYEVAEQTTCDSKGNWLLKGVRPGNYRIVARASEFVPYRIDYLTVDEEPGWERHETKMKKSAVLKGQVVDSEKKPLAEADVRLVDMDYASADDFQATTNEKGEFELTNVPVGQASIRVFRKGYYAPGKAPTVTIPSENVVVGMTPAGEIRIEVVFSIPRKSDYVIHMADATGAGVGKWGGSGNINQENWIEFKNVTPGKYLVYGQPNPGSTSEKTKTIEVEIVGGKSLEIELQANDGSSK